MNGFSRYASHSLLAFFLFIMFLPIYLALVTASHSGHVIMHQGVPAYPGAYLISNMKTVLTSKLATTGNEPIERMLWNSFVMAILIATGKIVLAIASAFSLIYFSFPFKRLSFALIYATMMLPVEVRIMPTFQVVTSLGWLNSFSGLSIPLIASATATFLFRQFFKTLPKELVDAARLDGASPCRFFYDILLPLSKSQIGALFIIMFVYAWNQYIWPLVITSDPHMATIVMGIRYLAGASDQVPQWHYIMAMALIALLPPCLVIVSLQHSFEKGLKQ